MSINKARIRAKLAAMTSNGASAFWSPPKEGQATVRLFDIPNHDDPFIELFFHYNVSKQSVLCLRRNLNEEGKPERCPICDLADELFRSASPEDREMSKQIYAKPRYYAAMVDRADGELTPKYWGFGKTIAAKMMKWLGEENGDYENFLDTKEGLDLVVTITKTPGKSFADTDVAPKRRESALCDPKDLQTLMNSLKSPSELWPRPTFADLEAKLDQLEQATEGESEQGVSKPAAPPAGNKAASQHDIDAAFAQLDM